MTPEVRARPEIAERRQEKRCVWIDRAPFSTEVEQALERLFANVFCSAARVVDEQSSDQVHAYVVAVDDAIRLVILFAKRGHAVTVLNETFALSHADLAAFAQDIFRCYEQLDLISLPSVSVGAVNLSHPLQRFNATEDIVAQLPDTVEHYWTMLSKNTRESIHRYRKRISQQLPELKFDIYERDAVGRDQLLAIIDLSRARIESKREAPSHTEESIAQLTRMIAKYGVTLLATLNGKVCAGVICTRIGKNFYMHVIAHDPALDAFRLGKVCCYLSICDAIERGGKEYHMLSGRYDYKFRFLGQQREYDRITVYRSHLSVFLNLPRYLLNGLRGEGRKLKKTIKNWRRKWKR